MICIVVDADELAGNEVRWYPIYKDWRDGHPPIISASKLGVMINGYIDRIPENVYDAAHEVARALKRNPKADVSGYATHNVARHDLVPIERPSTLETP